MLVRALSAPLFGYSDAVATRDQHLDHDRDVPDGPKEDTIDLLPFGLTAGRTALRTIVNYALQQSLIPRNTDVEEMLDDTTRARGLTGKRPRF